MIRDLFVVLVATSKGSIEMMIEVTFLSRLIEVRDEVLTDDAF
jgi:hypothetical protein